MKARGKREARRPWKYPKPTPRPEGPRYMPPYYALFRAGSVFDFVTRGDALASLRACPRLSYCAPSALAGLIYFYKISTHRRMLRVSVLIVVLAATAYAQTSKLIKFGAPVSATIEGYDKGHCVALPKSIRICKLLSDDKDTWIILATHHQAVCTRSDICHLRRKSG